MLTTPSFSAWRRQVHFLLLPLLLGACQVLLEDIPNPGGESCGDGLVDPGETCDSGNLDNKTCVDFGFQVGSLRCGNDCRFDLSECRKKACSELNWNVDVLFVVDSSGSMANEQAKLASAMTDFVSALHQSDQGLPNLHIGFITPDLGSAPYNLPGCETPGGDGGVYLKGSGNSCINPVNQKYVVDIEPRGCTIVKNVLVGEVTTCPTHDCSQDHCDPAAFSNLDGVPTEPSGLQLALDSNGCPRCRNYTDQILADVLECMTAIGTTGCGFEQPLEAMYQALNSNHEDNELFLRNDAVLTVFFVTDEDDCSVSKPLLFSPDEGMTSTLGPLTSFRCTEFGLICQQDWQRYATPMTYSDCRPREVDDPISMLHPITRYSENLRTLKKLNPILVGALAGPYDGQLIVEKDQNDWPVLQYTCVDDSLGAVPAVRIKNFVELMMSSLPNWSWSSICAGSYKLPLERLSGVMIEHLAECQN